MTVESGILYDETIEAYHANEATSHSKLEVLRDPDRGPARYHGRFIAKTIPEGERKAHFDVGNALDALLLEGARSFRRRVHVLSEDHKGRTDAGKAIVERQRSRGKAILSHNEGLLVARMAKAACNNPDLARLIKRAKAGVTFRSKLKYFSVQARPDKWNVCGVRLPSTGKPTGAYILDLKSAEDMPRFLKFLPKYARQAALYVEVVRMALAEVRGCSIDEVEEIAHFFGVVFKSEPIGAVVYQLAPDDITAAAGEVREDLKFLRACYKSGTWPGCPAGVVQLPRIWRKLETKTEDSNG